MESPRRRHRAAGSSWAGDDGGRTWKALTLTFGDAPTGDIKPSNIVVVSSQSGTFSRSSTSACRDASGLAGSPTTVARNLGHRALNNTGRYRGFAAIATFGAPPRPTVNRVRVTAYAYPSAYPIRLSLANPVYWGVSGGLQLRQDSSAGAWGVPGGRSGKDS